MSVYNKKKLFYFMKPDNFYDRDDIKRIDKMDHAGDMLTLYDKLIFFTMNRDGLLAYKMGDEYEEYPIEDIAEDFNYPVELVKETLDVFSKFHTIEQTEEGFYFFPDSLEYTQSTTVGAERKKEQRKNRKLKQELEEESEDEVEEIEESVEVDDCPGYIQLNKEQNTNQQLILNKKLNKELKLNEYKDTNKQIDNNYMNTIKQIIDKLNEITHKKFTINNEFVNNWIVELLDQGYTIEHFIKVIKIKNDEWGDDPERRKFLRPGTLFNPDNFDKFLRNDFNKSDEEKLEAALEEFINDEE